MEAKYIKKQIDEMKEILDKINVLSKKGEKLLELAKAYLKDAEYFYNKNDLFRALEASSISWAYIDSGLHLELFSIPKRYAKKFTI